MAKIRKIYDQTIKPDGSKTTIYPITSTRAVYTPEGETLDSYLKDGYFHGADLRGYKTVSNVTDLPTTENQFGWLIGEDLYVWVGTGGNTLGGLYQNCGHFRTPYVPDDEDLIADSDNELKLKDRTVEDGGKGYVILRKNIVSGVNTLTRSMMTQTNTIYEIRYDFNLGEDITVPANCVLKFEGGSISGDNIINFNNCYIQGVAKFNSNVTFEGSINNNLFDVSWILDGDLGYKINKAQVNFKNIYVPFGNYIVETPIVINNIQILRCYADITYNGVLKNCEGVFLLKGGANADIYINRLQPNNSLSIDYTNNRIINCIGVEIRNINNSNIHINQIGYFNENLRVCNNNAWGCCYNHFYFGILYSANACIRVYQSDGEPGYGGQTRSWCHENSFHSGRLTHLTDNKVWGDWNYIVLGGPALDLPSYKITGIVDSYDTVNALVFENMSLECNKPPFIARNTSSLSVINCRNESNPYLGKFIGNATNILFVPKENSLNILYISDFSEATYVTFRNNDYNKTNVTLYKTATGNNIDFEYAKVLSGNKGAIVDTSTYKIFRADIKEKSRFVIMFLDDNNNNITENYSNKLPNPYVYYNSTSKLFTSGTDTTGTVYIVPNQINKVFIGVNTNSTNINKITISTIGDNVLFTDINLYGTTEQRPNALPAGVSYFSTSLNKPIYYNGSSYVDGEGNIITWPVTATVLNITYPKPIPQAINGEQYSITISPKEGYTLPNSVTVKMNNIQLTRNTDFTYDSTTGEIIILGSGGTGGVTGPVWFSAYA